MPPVWKVPPRSRAHPHFGDDLVKVPLAGEEESSSPGRRVADRRGFGCVDEPLHELVVDVVLDEEPGARQADLAGVAEDRLTAQ